MSILLLVSYMAIVVCTDCMPMILLIKIETNIINCQFSIIPKIETINIKDMLPCQDSCSSCSNNQSETQHRFLVDNVIILKDFFFVQMLEICHKE